MARALLRAAPLWLAVFGVWWLARLLTGPETTSIEEHRLALALHLYDQHQLVLAPQAPGFELLIAPLAGIGGETLVRAVLAALGATAFCFAAALGRRLMPEPWPTRGALVAGLSAPAIGAGTAIAPGMVGAAFLSGAVMLVLSVRERPRLGPATGAAAAVALLPWLAIKLAAPAVLTAALLWRWLRRRRRRLAGLIALEIVAFSWILYATLSDRIFGVLTPSALAQGGATGASGLLEHLARAPRLATTLFGPEAGLILWAPVLALAAVAASLLVRSRREGLARTLPGQTDVEVAGLVLFAVAGVVWLTAAFLAPEIGTEGGVWTHGRQLIPALPLLAALSAYGWRRLPRAGAVLAAATLLLSGLMVVGVV